MAHIVDAVKATPEYLSFEEWMSPARRGQKTKIWLVVKATYPNSILGEIRWSPRWRQYALYPNADTLWSAGCMVAVAEFLASHRATRA
jgi:hypothetical protein